MTFHWPRKRNKYGNVPCHALGIKFRSKRERDYAIYLEGEKEAGRIEAWAYEHRFSLLALSGEYVQELNRYLIGKQDVVPHIKGVEVGTHKPDFVVFYKKNGLEVKEVHEVKQPYTMTALWRLKKKIFEANYPNILYKVIEK